MAYTYDDFLKKATETGTLGDFDQEELTLAQAYPDYGLSAASLKQESKTASTTAQRALADQAASQLKSSYTNGFVGSYDQTIEDVLDQIGSFGDFTYDQTAPTYDNQYQEEQDKVLGQIGSYEDFTYDKVAPDYVNIYKQLQKDLLDKVLNREDFTWSKETDPVFGTYQKQYLREGERATANALAQAAAASGGQTSSYAANAAAQAGNYYAAQLSDKIPELYNQAYQRYLNEYEMMANDLGLVNTQEQMDYQQYLDQLGQYNTDRNFAYQQYLDNYNKLQAYLDALNSQEQLDYQKYLDAMGQYNTDRNFSYQQYLDDYNKLQSYLGNLQSANDSEYQKYLDQIAQERYEQEQALEQQRYEQEWNQSLQEQAQAMAQAQVDGMLQAGTAPSSALVAASGYSQEYINAMLAYYRQQAANAARSYSSYSSGSKSSGSSSSQTAGTSSDNQLIIVPKYGEVTVSDAERLRQAGLLRYDGTDSQGKPVYTPLAQKNNQNVAMVR